MNILILIVQIATFTVVAAMLLFLATATPAYIMVRHHDWLVEHGILEDDKKEDTEK